MTIWKRNQMRMMIALSSPMIMISFKKSSISLITNEINEYTNRDTKFFLRTPHDTFIVSAIENLWYICFLCSFQYYPFPKILHKPKAISSKLNQCCNYAQK